MKKEHNIIYTLKNTRIMFARIWKLREGKQYISIKTFMTLIDAGLSFIIIVMPGLIINYLTEGIVSPQLFFCVGVLVLEPLFREFLHGIGDSILCGLGQKIQLIYIDEFYRHVTKMDYETLEKPDIQEQKGRAIDVLDNSLGIINQLEALFQSVISLLLLISIISLLNPLIILVILCTIGMDAVAIKRLNQKRYELDKEINSRKLMRDAMKYMLDDFKFVKDTRLFQAGNLLIEKFSDSERKRNKPMREKVRVTDRADLLSAFLNFLSQMVLYIYLIYMMVEKGMAAGNVVIFLSASGRFSVALHSITKAWLALAAEAIKFDDYLKFLAIPCGLYTSGKLLPIFDKNSMIEFRNVSFRYPGSDRFAVQNLNLILRGTEKLCIVGENGAGKSTFIKLLTRLYTPTEGEILLNGIRVNEYDYERYQRLFAAIFQDYSQFYMTLGENIVLADRFNKKRLDQVCCETGLDALVKRLTKGYDTQVDKWIDEDGVELSGGESQKMAIARACYHGAEIYLLDEPTASLDPNAEYEIYKKFDSMTEGKCAVFITHRLAAVQLADKIAVFENGKIKEYGTSKELYKKRGIYAEMYDKQAQFYRNSNEEIMESGSLERM